MARVAGHAEPFVDMERTAVGKDVRVSAQPLPAFARSLHTRLYVADGARRSLWGQQVSALGHFRLHLESAAAGNVFGIPVAAFKAYEVVRGARLEGRCRAGELVRLRLGVQTNTGRGFTWEAETRADAGGVFGFVVPYATGDTGAPCRAAGPYRIKAGDRVVHLEVSEDAVLAGEVVTVPAAPAEQDGESGANMP
jgi:hypothetical protein